jgi:hypothetical protein
MDEFVKRLRHSANFAERGLTPPPSELREAADVIEQLSNAGSAYGRGWTLGYDAGRDENKPRWIPVTERLPEEYVNVLCHLRSLDRQSEYYSIDHLMEDGQWWKAANSWKHEVTHWMPLPSTEGLNET